MDTAYETDERLKSYLDGNQLARERMCVAILSVDRRFSEVHPRQPRGGADGGHDIGAIYNDQDLAFGAISFRNQATDSANDKRAIAKKFGKDLDRALSGTERPRAFVFMTNVSLSVGAKDKLISLAKSRGVSVCDIYDRERLRLVLDSPDGFATRVQYLNLPLSPTEQAAFFARWGDDINSVIANGFRTVERKLDRILFLQEAEALLSGIHVVFKLDRSYSSDELGHFRAFLSMYVRDSTCGITHITFGASDGPNRFGSAPSEASRSPGGGLRNGVSGGQWEGEWGTETSDDDFEHGPARSSSGIGTEQTETLSIAYSHDDFIRFRPRLTLREINHGMFLFYVNASLATRIRSITIYANSYRLDKYTSFKVDAGGPPRRVEGYFSETELADPWAKIRPGGVASAFQVSFTKVTPKRLFDSPPALEDAEPE